MSHACTLMLAAVLTATAPLTPTREADADLDGDGKREHVTLEVTKPGAFRLSAGKAVVEAGLPGVRGFTVLDLDNTDKRREVLVHGEVDGTARFRLFLQQGTALQEVPLPPGLPSASGNNILLCDVSMADGWSRRDKYLYDAKQPGFTEVPQELHAVGRVLAAPRHVELQRVPGSKEVVAVAEAGRALTLHAFKPDPGDTGGGWYLTGEVDGAPGVLGWLPVSALRKAPPGAAPEAAPPASTPVPPELYALDLKPRVDTSFPLLRTRRDEAEPVAKLRAGSTVTVLATDGSWNLVRSETGLLGWTRADTRAQLQVLQLRLRAVMPAPPAGSEPWRPSASGLILEYESGGAYETYHLCPDGRVALAFLVDDHTKYGTWTLDGDTLKLSFTRETRKEGVGEPLPMPEGQEGLRQYREYTSSEGPLAESATLSWAEVLEDLRQPTPSFFTPRRGTPTCR